MYTRIGIKNSGRVSISERIAGEMDKGWDSLHLLSEGQDDGINIELRVSDDEGDAEEEIIFLQMSAYGVKAEDGGRLFNASLDAVMTRSDLEKFRAYIDFVLSAHSEPPTE